MLLSGWHVQVPFTHLPDWHGSQVTSVHACAASDSQQDHLIIVIIITIVLIIVVMIAPSVPPGLRGWR